MRQVGSWAALSCDRKFPAQRGTEAGVRYLISCSWIYLSLHTHSIYTGIHVEHKDCVCLVCIGVWRGGEGWVMHLCGDSKLPSKDRQGDFPSSKLPGRSQERLCLCLLSLAHSDLQKAFWPEIIMAHFPTKISKTQPSASAESEINLAPRLWLQGICSQRFHKWEYPVPKRRNAGENPTFYILGLTLSYAESPTTTHSKQLGLLSFTL